MILQQLQRDADRLVGEIPPPMYDRKPIRWVIDLRPDGTFVGWVPLSSGVDTRGDRGREMLVPYVTRTSATKPILLVDTPEYVLGRNEENPQRAEQRHQAFVELVERCAEQTGLPSVQAVLTFLTSEALPDPPKEMDDRDLITFRVAEALPVDHPKVQEFWERHTADPRARQLQCLVCGRTAPAEPNLPVKIKGIPQGQPSGTQIVSANADVFESYGLERALTSPICRRCGERFGKAINALISGENTSLRVGPVVYVFWSVDAPGFSPLSFLRAPDPGVVRDLIKSYATGKQISVEDTAAFYATALSASGGRAVVRDWLETTVGSVKNSLARWFQLQSIVDWNGSPGPFLGVWDMARSLYRKADDIPAWVPKAMVSAALYGNPLPDSLLSTALQRNRADAEVTHARAAVMKAVLCQDMPSKEATRMTELDATNRNPAYLCGRLLAVLESVQRQAAPGIKATIVDRFFGSASSAPASVFGTLMRLSQSHLEKLRKTREPAYHALQNRIESVLADLEQFPSTLTLREQALFCLGYYHQRAADRKAARERSQIGTVEDEEVDADE
ncbi:MAG: type I-C CRISPR-associated protein Cas8c/Csd1 [Candidatus Methanomethyliaceae archaeon]